MDLITAIFITASSQFGLPPKLLESLCWVESKHNVQAVHHDDGGTDSLGICQIKLETAKWLGFKGTRQELMKPEVNIKYAAIYLSKQIKRYDGNIERGVVAYNRGNAKNLQSSNYSAKVLSTWTKDKQILTRR